jgi:FtsH-binding integral membrane protein
MNERRKLTYALALLGLVIAAVIFTYLEITNYDRLGNISIGLILILCPPALLSVAFLDIQPHSVEITIGWLIIGATNAALYGAIGASIGKHLWKSR